MVTVINFIWQSIFCLAFLYGLYWVFLKSEKTFHFNRIFLLLAPVFAFVFPLMEIPVSFYKPSISLEGTGFLKALQIHDDFETIGTFGLPEVTVTGSKLPLLWGLMDYLILTYLLVIAFLLLKLFYQYIQLRQILEKGWYQTVYKLKGEYFLVPTFGLAPIFSFFDKIFWDDTQPLNPLEETQILQHELEHIRQKHTWDILYYQVLSVFFWFNPVIHLMRISLVDLHEYLADEKVLNHTGNKETYPKLIVKMAFKGLDLPIGNYFIRSTTLKRILMMKKQSKINWFRMAMVIPLLAMLFALVSMKTHDGLKLFHKYETTPVGQLKHQLNAVQDSLDVSIKVRSLKKPEHYEWIGTFENEKLTAQLGELEYEFSEISTVDEYLKVRSLINVLRSSSKMIKTYENAIGQYAIDHRPKPVLGWEHWETYLKNHLMAPEFELDLGVSGRVELEFVVDKEGKILNPVIKQSFGGGVEQQILDLLNNPHVPAWEPGREGEKPVKAVVNTSLVFQVSNSEEHEFFLAKSDASNSPKLSTDHEDWADTQVMEKMPATIDVQKRLPIRSGLPEKGQKIRQKGVIKNGDNNDIKLGKVETGAAFNKHMSKNLKYPVEERKNKITGTVLVKMELNEKGEIIKYHLMESPSPGMEKEVLRNLEDAPAMKVIEKKPSYEIILPVIFRISDIESEIDTQSIKEQFGGGIVVTGYGTQEGKKFKPELPPMTFQIPLNLINKDLLNFDGQIIKIDKHLVTTIKKILEKKGTDKENTLIVLSAGEDVKMGTVQTVQEALRSLGLRKIKFTSSSRN